MPEKPRPQIPDTTTGDVRRLPAGRWRLPEALSAFSHRNYRIFFTGQAVSLIGTWLQSTAEGWLVYQLSGSSVALGFIRFAHMLPFALLALWGGIAADRHPKRSILLCTQTASMMLALLLALLVWQDVIEVWHVAAIGFLLGTVNAFDVPARQSFVVELVGRDNLDNGIALNSSMFNLARVIGPAVAGLLIGLVGMAGCFLLNGLSYLAVIAGYLMLRLPHFEKRRDHPTFGSAIREAGAYILGNGPLRRIMMLVSTFSIFGISFIVLMPVFAKDILGGDAATFGTLMACNGGGALAGALTLATFGKRFRRRTRLYAGLFGCSALNVVFALSRIEWLSCLLLLFSGFFMIIFLATANTSTQLRSPDALRGRIMGFYSLAFLGLSSVGSLLTGFLAKHLGTPQTVALGATVCAVIGSLLLRRITPLAADPRAEQEKSD